MNAAPTLRAPLWQETLHQAILLTLRDILKESRDEDKYKMYYLIPSITKRYPSIKKVGCDAVFKRPGCIPNVRKIESIYAIDGQYFDHTGWLRQEQLSLRAQSAFGSNDPTSIDLFSCWVDRKSISEDPPSDMNIVWEVDKIFSSHMANLEAGAIEFSTLGISPLSNKRGPRL